jgi:hypothetical protein
MDPGGPTVMTAGPLRFLGTVTAETALNQGDHPIYYARGAPPRPSPSAGPRGSPWRGPMILVVVMIGWLLFTLLLAAIAAPAGAGSPEPVELGQSVTVTPADGWTSAADVWEVGPSAVSLKRAGAIAVFAAERYDGTSEQLMAAELDNLKGEFDSLSELPAAESSVAGLPALTVLFSGTADSSRLEGELVAAAGGGIGVVMLAVAPAGQLPRVQADLDDMLESMVVPR